MYKEKVSKDKTIFIAESGDKVKLVVTGISRCCVAEYYVGQIITVTIIHTSHTAGKNCELKSNALYTLHYDYDNDHWYEFGYANFDCEIQVDGSWVQPYDEIAPPSQQVPAQISFP